MSTIFKGTRILPLLITLCLLGMQTRSSAQPTPVAATMPDKLAAGISAANQPSPSVNCDMLELQGGRTLKAIVWDDKDIYGNTNQGYFMVEDYVGNRVMQSLPFPAYDLDVVLGNNMSNPTGAYKMGIVCRLGGSIQFLVYNINNVGGALAVNLLSVTAVSGNTTTPPHVDMWSDAALPINGKPSMHELVVTGTNGAGNLFAFKTDIMNPQFTNVTLQQFNTPVNAAAHDVAAYTNAATGQEWMVVSYTSLANNDLFYFEFNTTTQATPALNNIQPSTSYYPRVEAMSRYTPTTQSNRWEIVAVVSTGGGWQIRGFNPIVPVTVLSTAVGWPASGDYYAPAVAAGIGIPGPLAGNVGNRYYISGFYKAGSNVWSRNINTSNGQVNPTFIYAVNTNAINPPFAARHYAVSSCSNSGFNILSAWYDGAKLWYKESGGMAFKPTGIEEATALPAVKLYPNPATDRLFAEGIDKKCAYVVLDISGRVMVRGEYGTDGIDIHALLPGMYVLQLQQGKTSLNARFIRK